MDRPISQSSIWRVARDHGEMLVTCSGSASPRGLFGIFPQADPVFALDATAENKCARAAIVLLEAEGEVRASSRNGYRVRITLAVEARELLQRAGVPTAADIHALLAAAREAWQSVQKSQSWATSSRGGRGVEGWDCYLGFHGRLIGMHAFGESGKISDVYQKFKTTTDALAQAAREVMSETL